MKKSTKKISVRADIKKNRLYTTLKGSLTEEDLAALPDELRKEAKKLKHGYTAISDVKEYRPAGKGINEILSKTMKAAVETGVGKVIRIVSGEEANVLETISQSEHGYSAIICKSMSEAEKEAEKIENKRKNL